MDWNRYIKEAKRVELTDAQYRAAAERMEQNNHAATKQLFYTISNAGGGGSTLAKLRKLIFAGTKATIYDFERGSVDLGKVDKDHISLAMSGDERRVLHAALGLAEEALEVVSLLPNLLTGRRDAATSLKMAMELGDVVWFLAILCDALGLSLPALCAGNAAKLRVRYPNGFDPDKSKARDVALETAAFLQAMDICKQEEKDREAGDWTGNDVAAKDAEIARLVKRIGELQDIADRDLQDVERFRTMARQYMDERDQARAELEAMKTMRGSTPSGGAGAYEWRRAIETALGVEDDAENHDVNWAYILVLAVREIGNGAAPDPIRVALTEMLRFSDPDKPLFRYGDRAITGPEMITMLDAHDPIAKDFVADVVFSAVESMKAIFYPESQVSTKPLPIPPDDEVGLATPPARYNKEGRPECLDEIRMALGHGGFQSWLIGTIIKYAYRSGAKPGDMEKEMFYRQLLQHVAGVPVPDPRASRKGWTPRSWNDDHDWRDQQDEILKQYFSELR